MLIPVIEDVIVLNKDTTLLLKNVSQNKNFIKKYSELFKNTLQVSGNTYSITLSKGTLLTIDRVYIRQGDNADFNSITFKISQDKNLPNGRFFISVREANNLDIDFLGQNKDTKPIKIKTYLKQLSKANKNQINGVICEEILKKNEVYNFSININVERVINLLSELINEWCLKNLNTVFTNLLDQYIEHVIEQLNSPKPNISLEAKEIIDSLPILDFNGDNLKKELRGKPNVSFMGVKIFKIIEDQPLITTHLLKFTANNDTDNIFAKIKRYLNNVNYVINFIRNKEDSSLSRFPTTEINVINNLLNDINIDSYLLKKKNIIDYDSPEFYYNNLISFFPYDQLKDISLFNVKNFEKNFFNEFVIFSDNENNDLSPKDLRAKMTKCKKI